MLRFIHAVGLLILSVLVHVHACTQKIILVFVCGTYVPTLAYLWYLVGGRDLTMPWLLFLFASILACSYITVLAQNPYIVAIYSLLLSNVSIVIWAVVSLPT